MFIRSLIAGAALVALAACAPKTEEAAAPEPAPPAQAAGPQTDSAAADEAPRTTIKVDLTATQAPVVGQKLISPVQIEGVAPARWYFEAVFPVRLVVNGEVVAEAPARSQDDWTNGNDTHPFVAKFTFMVTKETKAELQFEEDMPGQDDKGDDLPAKRIAVPVTLAPSN